ncbi:hypothetical protein CANCADRAFT_14006, partial [Tortispora caseinolytica NRRL Y-17796]
SPLLATTPPTVARALAQAYPFVTLLNNVAALLSWTSPDPWESCLMLPVWILTVMYSQTIMLFLPLFLASLLVNVLPMRGHKGGSAPPTLDTVVHELATLSTRLQLLSEPWTTALAFLHRILDSPSATQRSIITLSLLFPVHIFISLFLFSPKLQIALVGVLALSFHSLPSRIARIMLWRSRLVRHIASQITGLEFAIPPPASLKESSVDAHLDSSRNSNEPVRFSYVVYENQRKWLGVGWTSSMSSYERGAWTDEFLNTVKPIDQFELPKIDPSYGYKWQWADPSWHIDKSFSIESDSSKTDTEDNEGWIYYDNSWKNPSLEESSFGHYTRRRRWVRTAELVPLT